jgi:hypothetical protein
LTTGQKLHKKIEDLEKRAESRSISPPAHQQQPDYQIPQSLQHQSQLRQTSHPKEPYQQYYASYNSIIPPSHEDIYSIGSDSLSDRTSSSPSNGSLDWVNKEFTPQLGENERSSWDALFSEHGQETPSCTEQMNTPGTLAWYSNRPSSEWDTIPGQIPATYGNEFALGAFYDKEEAFFQ